MNKERVGDLVLQEEGGYRDIAVIQDCDSAVEEICRQCGWSRQLKALLKPPTAGQRQATHMHTPPVAANKRQTSSKKLLPNKADNHY